MCGQIINAVEGCAGACVSGKNVVVCGEAIKALVRQVLEAEAAAAAATAAAAGAAAEGGGRDAGVGWRRWGVLSTKD
jgi:hypothetical protein